MNNKTTEKLPFRKLGLFEGFTIFSAISKFGNQLYYFVIPLYIYEITGSGFAMGLGWVFQTIPYLFTPYIGKLIDTLDKKTIYIVAGLLQFILVLLIPIIITLTGIESVLIIYTFSSLVQTAGVASNIVSDYSFVPDFKRTEDTAIWNSYYITINNIGRVAGPALASVSAALLGYLSTLYINSLTYLLSIVFVLIFVPKMNPIVAPKIKISDGLKVVISNKILKNIVISSIFLNLATGGMIVMYLFLMKSYWNLNETTIGIIMSSSILTGIIGSILGAKLFKFKAIKTKLSFWTLLLLILMAPLISLNPYAAIIGFIFSSLCINAINVIFMSFRQEVIPSELIGRTNAFIRMILLGVVPISSIILMSLGESDFKRLLGFYITILISLSFITLIVGNKEENKIPKGE
ncbi:MFS transporter [Sporosarcina sp. FSL K6-1508]|uniref:MFS transporter n=1 Tax=Sporosarcina sp. FSL K6-1508 TaxID=2921553 RepID=UPI0030F9FC5F